MDGWVSSQQEGGEVIAISNTGYTSNELGLHWLAHFIKHTGQKARRESPAIILLMDGHSSHQSLLFRIMSEEHNIILREFPPHCTNFLQPLDVKCFNPYKHWHSKAIRRAIRSGEFLHNIVSFLWDLPEIRRKARTKETIKSGFHCTGMWPFNEEQAVRRMTIFEPVKPLAYVRLGVVTS